VIAHNLKILNYHEISVSLIDMATAAQPQMRHRLQAQQNITTALPLQAPGRTKSGPQNMQ
jgi:hypothetical protein